MEREEEEKKLLEKRGWLCRERAKIGARGRRATDVNLALLPHTYTALIQHKEKLKYVEQARPNQYSHEYTSQEEEDLNNE